MGLFSSSIPLRSSNNASYDFYRPYLKETLAIEVKDFHPISLVSEVYKIILKVLDNRLSMVWNKLFLRLKMPLLEGDKFLIRSSLPMNTWTIDWRREFHAFYASLTWKRRMIL